MGRQRRNQSINAIHGRSHPSQWFTFHSLAASHLTALTGDRQVYPWLDPLVISNNNNSNICHERHCRFAGLPNHTGHNIQGQYQSTDGSHGLDHSSLPIPNASTRRGLGSEKLKGSPLGAERRSLATVSISRYSLSQAAEFWKHLLIR